jgi:hypothetical protein
MRTAFSLAGKDTVVAEKHCIWSAQQDPCPHPVNALYFRGLSYSVVGVCRIQYVLGEFWPLGIVFISLICSLYLVLNVRPVCPIYLRGHSLHAIWYTPLQLYMSVIFSLAFTCCFIVLLVLNATFMVVFQNNLAIILILGPNYVKVIHFSFCIVLFLGDFVLSLFLIWRGYSLVFSIWAITSSSLKRLLRRQLNICTIIVILMQQDAKQ